MPVQTLTLALAFILPMPTLDDLVFLPPEDVAIWGMRAARKQYYDAIYGVDLRPNESLNEREQWIAEIDAVDDAWLALYNARAFRSVENLEKLRRLIGPKAYYSGTMPAPVILKYLRQKD